MATELYGFSERPDGRTVLHIVTQGSAEPFSSVFTNAELIRHIQRAARKHPGLLQLKDPVAHRMMMDEGKDRITGLDPKANMDFIHGRPTREDDVLFGFAAYKETGNGFASLHNEVGRLTQMVVAKADIDKLADPGFVQALVVQHSGYHPRVNRLHDFAREWQRLRALPQTELHAATDRIWSVTVRTSIQ